MYFGWSATLILFAQTSSSCSTWQTKQRTIRKSTWAGIILWNKRQNGCIILNWGKKGCPGGGGLAGYSKTLALELLCHSFFLGRGREGCAEDCSEDSKKNKIRKRTITIWIPAGSGKTGISNWFPLRHVLGFFLISFCFCKIKAWKLGSYYDAQPEEKVPLEEASEQRLQQHDGLPQWPGWAGDHVLWGCSHREVIWLGSKLAQLMCPPQSRLPERGAGARIRASRHAPEQRKTLLQTGALWWQRTPKGVLHTESCGSVWRIYWIFCVLMQPFSLKFIGFWSLKMLWACSRMLLHCGKLPGKVHRGKKTVCVV